MDVLGVEAAVMLVDSLTLSGGLAAWVPASRIPRLRLSATARPRNRRDKSVAAVRDQVRQRIDSYSESELELTQSRYACMHIATASGGT